MTLQIAASRVTVGVTPSLIAAARLGRREIRILRTTGGSPPTLYIGNSDQMTQSSGYPVLVGTTERIIETAGDLYGLLTMGSSDYAILEIYDDSGSP